MTLAEDQTQATRGPRTAMVLAAGLGTRMRPITDHTPKPLVEVAGRSMLDRALDHLDRAGVTRAVVNLHHLADRVEAHLAQRTPGPAVVFSDERDTLLETGGGMVRARPLLGDDPVFALNADIIWLDGARPALTRLAEAWDPATMDALLLVVPRDQAHGYAGRGDFLCQPDPGSKAEDTGAVSVVGRPAEGETAPVIYGGVQIIKPSVLDGYPCAPWSLNKVFSQLIDVGRLSALVHDGGWFHVGTPDSIEPTSALIRQAERASMG